MSVFVDRHLGNHVSCVCVCIRIAKWASGEAERKKKEAEEKRQRLERKRAGPRHDFDDAGYMEQIKSTEEEMGGALKQGMCL